MKKLDLVSDGQRIDFRVDDVQYVFDEMKQTIDYIVSNLTGETRRDVILAGCRETASGLDKIIEAGVILLNGEVFPVAEHTGTHSVGGGKSWFWKITQTADAAGTVNVFGPTNTVSGTIDKYLNRTVTLVYEDITGYTSGTDAFLYDDVLKLNSGICSDNSFSSNPNYREITLLNDWTSPTHLSVFKAANGIVTMNARLDGTGKSADLILTLPVEMRPYATIYSGDFGLTINTNGNIECSNTVVIDVNISWPAKP